MKETNRIADQIERAWGGPAWHGPALAKILQGITPKQAVQHPLQNCHSIWELVLHSAAWAEAARESLTTGRTLVTDQENFPTVGDSGAEAWKAATTRLEKAHRDLASAIRQLDDSELDREVRGLDDRHSLYVLFHGVVQHSLYHAGQMLLLKKALT